MSGGGDRTAGERRADARRNRARVLSVAEESFAAGGLAVPLGEIARRAGVGPGTVYRHFASKEALFEAVVSDRIARLVDDTCALAVGEEPGTAFFAAFDMIVRQVAVNKALCDALTAGSGRVMTVAPHLGERFRAALAALLDRAQRAGAVRADVTVDDVQRLVHGCVRMESEGPTGRPTAIVCDGLRPTASDRLTGLPPVTEHPADARNETRPMASVGSRHGATAPRCAECGGPIVTARTGRPARFCGAACRQKAHRRRARNTDRPPRTG
ncbi:TetR/AcrR family transcriptional regulator [Actinoallomurus soli]|uniref:TetR/AcrR family transcriptional regulator n=1 Tax=Actinoallomurus soli TaxID=2952535 RepID=UPI002093C682|nr:helix-turn-helix domain-containing protein [Actinoallomurus soli]MCO5970242.1 TetR/AcrR family transcriptional regulator [Actinoallomurus soli]